MQESEQLKIIRQNEELAQVPEKELLWLIQKSELKSYAIGSIIFVKGDPIDRLFVLLKGKVKIQLTQPGGVRDISQILPSEVGGALPFSRAKTTNGEALVEENSVGLELAKSHFSDMVCHQPKLTEALVHIMTSRVRTFTHNQQQVDKLAALGKLSAGLHHELNNPASAVQRSAISLNESLEQTKKRLVPLLNKKSKSLLSAIIERVRPLEHYLSMLQRSELEDDFIDWFYELELPCPEDTAESLVNAGLTKSTLQQITQEETPDTTAQVLTFLGFWLSLAQKAKDIHTASSRITELVGAVKSYSHMDRDPSMEMTQLADGIRSTLVMLNHKLKEKSIRVDLLEEDWPKVCAYAGDLNQVWTNLLDNAIDAMPNGGTIAVRSDADNNKIKINITDEGEGIEQNIADKIFDPFYTTKNAGDGSGMGLDIAKKIIERHKGQLTFKSKPGETTFTVELPLSQE